MIAESKYCAPPLSLEAEIVTSNLNCSVTINRLAHPVNLWKGARRRSDVSKLLCLRDAMQLHDAAVDVVAHEVVAIVDGLGPSLETALLRNLDRRCAVKLL